MGNQFRQGKKDKGPLMKPRVGHGKNPPLGTKTLVEKEVKVQGAVGNLTLTPTSETSFYLPESEEQGLRGKGGL